MSPARPVEPRRSVPLSRRQLLALSLLTAAGVPAAGTVGPASARAGAGEEQAYQDAFLRVVTGDPDIRRHLAPGGEFLYRPRQLLVADADVSRVRAWLQQRGYLVTVRSRFARVTKLVFDREVDIPAIVRTLRDPHQWPGAPAPVVQPHHVTVGFGNIMGNPGGPPRLAAALPAPDPARAGEGAGVTVGICDTGIWRDAGTWHPAWLGGHYLPELDDEDPLYVASDQLASQGGHGTFVAGVVRQAAPGVSFDPEQALNAAGLGDEESLVAAIGRLTPAVQIVNLSLGCYTLDDVPPVPLVNAIAALPKTTAVVASAGNAGNARPSWPAALGTVVAVSAVQTGTKGLEPAGYSSFGQWVDVCSLGDRTSTYVKGRLVLSGFPDTHFVGSAAWAGTSFAAAHVSGRLAAMMTAAGWDAATARAALLAQPSWHPDYGVYLP